MASPADVTTQSLRHSQPAAVNEAGKLYSPGGPKKGLSAVHLKNTRRRFVDLCNLMERRITARPFLDTKGEKGPWSWLSKAPQHRVVRRQITVPGWPATSRTLRIAFLSDLHTGSHSDDVNRLNVIVKETMALRPDIVCLGGDYTNGMLFGRGRVPPETICEKLASLVPEHGTFAIIGDHDEIFGATRIISALRHARIEVLVNGLASFPFDGLPIQVVGVSSDASELPRLLKTVPSGAPAIILAHDPAAFSSMPAGPYIMLCGHTHGGQIQLPFVGPFVNMSDAPLKWTYGHVAEDGRNLYVTSGLGVSGLPLRIGIAPEIALIEVGAQ